ncbi:MAG: folate family ECF transporter S component [Lawsonibacter sp.]|jgi:ECF transporter S component (folate family)|nr:folate family ECF transporter S component [Lawsonibacter sp.]
MSINKKRFNIYTICMIALLTAMVVLLKRTIAIETPYFKFNFASLPIMLAAMLFGPVEGMVVGLLGEFIAQITGPYGLAPTTVLYVAPAAIRGVVVGLGAVWCRRTGKRIESRPVACYAICVAGAVFTTLGNTVSIWLESVMYHTEFMVHVPFLPGRFATGIATAVIVTTVCIPLVHALRRSGVVKYTD